MDDSVAEVDYWGLSYDGRFKLSSHIYLAQDVSSFFGGINTQGMCSSTHITLHFIRNGLYREKSSYRGLKIDQDNRI